VKSLAPAAVAIVADLTIDPAVYETLGMVGGEERPVRTRITKRASSKGSRQLTSFLQHLSVHR